MPTKKSHGIGHEHTQALADVLSWLRTQPDTTPLEIGVLEEIAGRLESHRHTAAVFRIRLLNRGRRATGKRSRPWSTDELAHLDRLWREGMRVEEIADRLGRSAAAVDNQIARMHLFGTRQQPLRQLTNYRGRSDPLMRAKAVIADRRRREALARREG